MDVEAMMRVTRRRAQRQMQFWRALNGNTRLGGCMHRPDGLLHGVIDQFGKVLVWCSSCLLEEVAEGDLLARCDGCGGQVGAGRARGWLETFEIERPIPAVPGFRGTITVALAQLCDGCGATENIVRMWQVSRFQWLLGEIRAGLPLPLAPPLSDSYEYTSYLCGLHPRVGIRSDAGVGMCLLDHALITRCSVCGNADPMLDARTGLISLDPAAYISAVDPDGMVYEISGGVRVDPLAYLCTVCAVAWPPNMWASYTVTPKVLGQPTDPTAA